MAKVLNISALKAAGIDFSEEVPEDDEIFQECPQAKQLVGYLLDFKHIITLETWKDLKLCKDIPIKSIFRENPDIVIQEAQPREKFSAALNEYNNRYDIQSCLSYYDTALRIKRESSNIESEDEDRWTEVIVHSVFGHLRSQARALEKKESYTAREALERFRMESEHTWQFGAKILAAFSHQDCMSSQQLTAPKPDLFLAFHGYNEHKRTGGPLSADENIHNFSITELCKVNEGYEEFIDKTWDRGKRPFILCPSPCKSFYGTGEVSYKNSFCFPWTVCEWKHHGKIGKSEERSKLFCQAANGAAVCLTLFANAASGGLPGDFLRDIRPVVYFTFTGHLSRVWIAYITSIKKGRYKYQMRCLWKGSLLNVVDNIKLVAIIDRLHFWAMNYLRPWLSGCIELWRRSMQSAKEQDDSAQDGKKCRKCGRVGKGQDHSAFEQDDTITFDDALKRADTLISSDEDDYSTGEYEYSDSEHQQSDDESGNNTDDFIEEDDEEEGLEQEYEEDEEEQRDHGKRIIRGGKHARALRLPIRLSP